MALSVPQPSTPVGAASTGAAAAQIIVYLVTLWVPAFANAPSGVQLALNIVVTAILAYLGGWLKVVRTPGQKFTTQLTASPLPTLEETPGTEHAA